MQGSERIHESHKTKAVKKIGQHLVVTIDKGMIFNLTTHLFDCWVDADFVRNWDRVNADIDPGTAKSRTGCMIAYSSCLILWGLKLQREVTLSSTEAECIRLSENPHEVIHCMQIIDELHKEVGQ